MPTWFDMLAAGAREHLPCLVVGEVAQAHDGSLGVAHAFVDAIADAGADAVKFQTHIAEAESTAREPWRVRFSDQDATRYDYWKRMEFTEEQWRGLKNHVVARGLMFLSSPFSLEALELLQRIGVPAWKIASGETGRNPLIDRAIETGRPVLISTGLSPLHEIDQVVQQLRTHGVPFAVLQCTTAYPCPAERVGLNLITELATRYDAAVGLSDHSGTIYPSLAAVTLGAQVVEVHVTLSRQMFGPDVVASLCPSELKQMIQGIRFIERMKRHPIDKDQAALDAGGLRAAFTKSVVARKDLESGTVLTRDHLALKKPGTGLPAAELSSLVGLRLQRSVACDEALSRADVESIQS